MMTAIEDGPAGRAEQMSPAGRVTAQLVLLLLAALCLLPSASSIAAHVVSHAVHHADAAAPRCGGEPKSDYRSRQFSSHSLY